MPQGRRPDIEAGKANGCSSTKHGRRYIRVGAEELGLKAKK